MKFNKVIILLLCVISLLCFTGCDAHDYKSALGMMESAKWSDAKDIFTALGDYKDSAAMLTECDYNIALDVMESGEHDTAAELFEALGEYKDSTDMVTECVYLSASVLMESGEYVEAIEKFDPIGDYKDCSELITDCKYLQACELFEGEAYDDALTLFETLDGYKDSRRYVIICSLLTDPYSFVDDFSTAVNNSYTNELIPYSLSARDSYGYDERSFTITGEECSGKSSVYFTNITSEWSNYRNGQINSIIVMGTASTSEEEVMQTFLEVVSTAGITLRLLDDSSSAEDAVYMLTDKYTEMLITGYPDTDAPVHFTEQNFDYCGYNCHLAISDLGGDYTRFVFAVAVPELVSE